MLLGRLHRTVWAHLLASDERVEPYTGFGERVVRQQARLAEPAPNVLVEQGVELCGEIASLPAQFPQLFFGLLDFLGRERIGFERLDALTHALVHPPQLVPPPARLVELERDASLELGGPGARAGEEPGELLAGLDPQHPPIEELEEASLERLAPRVDEDEEALRERARAVARAHELADAPRHLVALARPVVEAEGQGLSLQDLRRVEVAARRANGPGHGRLRFAIEVQIMLLGAREGQDEGVAREATRPTHPLHVARRARGHRAQHRGGEIADVDTHLERRRTGQHVGRVRPGALLELELEALALVALEQARVLARPDAPERLGLVEAPVVALCPARSHRRPSGERSRAPVPRTGLVQGIADAALDRRRLTPRWV